MICHCMCRSLFSNLVNHGKNLCLSQKLVNLFLRGFQWLPAYVRPLNSITVKFCKSYRNCEDSYPLCPPDTKEMESFSLTGCCIFTFLWLNTTLVHLWRRHNCLEETNHLLSSPQLKHRGLDSVTSYQCCGWEEWGRERRGRGFCSPVHHERERNPSEVSLSLLPTFN